MTPRSLDVVHATSSQILSLYTPPNPFLSTTSISSCRRNWIPVFFDAQTRRFARVTFVLHSSGSHGSSQCGHLEQDRISIPPYVYRSRTRHPTAATFHHHIWTTNTYQQQMPINYQQQFLQASQYACSINQKGVSQIQQNLTSSFFSLSNDMPRFHVEFDHTAFPRRFFFFVSEIGISLEWITLGQRTN